MFHYEVVHHPVRRNSPSWEEILHAKAAEGFRLVQVLVEQPAAVVDEFVLIFERPAESTPDSDGTA